METGILTVVLASAGAGLALRGRLRPWVKRLLLAAGLGALALAAAVVGLATLGWMPGGTLAGGLAGAVLLTASAALLPLAVTVHWRRRSG